MAWYRVDREGSTETPVMTARECAAAAVWRGKIIITNGNDASVRFKDILEFDPKKLTMEKHACAQNAAQVPVSAHTFTSCDKQYYYQFGGWDGSRDIVAMFRYDAEGRNWTPVPPLGEVPAARHFHTCVGLGDRILLFGGYDGARWTSDLYSFTPATGRWKRESTPPGEPVPVARASHHSVALDSNRIAVFAGFDGAEFLSDLWVLHATTQEELDEAGLPKVAYRWEKVDRGYSLDYWAEPRSGGGMVAYNNHLIVYGGRCRRDGRVAFSDRVEVFSFDSYKWREVKSTGAVPPPRKCFAYAQLDNKMFMFGGLGVGSAYFRDVHCLDLDSVIDDDTLVPVPPPTMAEDLRALVIKAFEHVFGDAISPSYARDGCHFDSDVSGRLRLASDGQAYTDQDFQVYFAQALSPSSSTNASPDVPSNPAVQPSTDPVRNSSAAADGSVPSGGDANPVNSLSARAPAGPHSTGIREAVGTPPGYRRLDRSDNDGLSAFADVVFQVEGHRISLHKVVLASRSEYFRVMLSARWLDTSSTSLPVLQLEDITLRSFWHIMHYIYTDELPTDFDVTEDALDVMAQAQKFDLGRLSLICQRSLQKLVGQDTVCDILRQADMLNTMSLRLLCMNFILDHFEVVTVQPAFIALPENLIREVLVRRSKRLTSTQGPTLTGPASVSVVSSLGSPVLSPLQSPVLNARRMGSTRGTPRSSTATPRGRTPIAIQQSPSPRVEMAVAAVLRAPALAIPPPVPVIAEHNDSDALDTPVDATQEGWMP